jgi:hypothetical protein
MAKEDGEGIMRKKRASLTGFNVFLIFFDAFVLLSLQITLAINGLNALSYIA